MLRQWGTELIHAPLLVDLWRRFLSWSPASSFCLSSSANSTCFLSFLAACTCPTYACPMALQSAYEPYIVSYRMPDSGRKLRSAFRPPASARQVYHKLDGSVRWKSVRQYEEIKKLITEIKLSSSYPNTRSPITGAGAATTDHKTLKLLHTAIKKFWSIGGFCSSHGWGVGHLHSSSSCKNKAPVHVYTATQTNPAGPGATRNKGWDDFA